MYTSNLLGFQFLFYSLHNGVVIITLYIIILVPRLGGGEEEGGVSHTSGAGSCSMTTAVQSDKPSFASLL